MIERQQLQIKIVEEAKSKSDYCVVPTDEYVRNSLIQILDLERQLLKEGLSVKQWARAMMCHIVLWNELPFEYKSELSDSAAISM
jgi:hypothetical protein